MILNLTTPPFPEMSDFTLQGINVGAPDFDLHAPTDVAVAKDGEMPIVKIDVSGITTRRDQVFDTNHPQDNKESKKKNGFQNDVNL